MAMIFFSFSFSYKVSIYVLFCKNQHTAHNTQKKMLELLRTLFSRNATPPDESKPTPVPTRVPELSQGIHEMIRGMICEMGKKIWIVPSERWSEDVRRAQMRPNEPFWLGSISDIQRKYLRPNDYLLLGMEYIRSDCMQNPDWIHLMIMLLDMHASSQGRHGTPPLLMEDAKRLYTKFEDHQLISRFLEAIPDLDYVMRERKFFEQFQ